MNSVKSNKEIISLNCLSWIETPTILVGCIWVANLSVSMTRTYLMFQLSIFLSFIYRIQLVCTKHRMGFPLNQKARAFLIWVRLRIHGLNIKKLVPESDVNLALKGTEALSVFVILKATVEVTSKFDYISITSST